MCFSAKIRVFSTVLWRHQQYFFNTLLLFQIQNDKNVLMCPYLLQIYDFWDNTVSNTQRNTRKIVKIAYTGCFFVPCPIQFDLMLLFYFTAKSWKIGEFKRKITAFTYMLVTPHRVMIELWSAHNNVKRLIGRSTKSNEKWKKAGVRVEVVPQ